MTVVTEAEVKALIGQAADTIDMTPHIDAARIIVDEDLASAGHSDNRLRQILRFLAAHFATLAIERGGLTRYEVGESVESYKPGSDLDRGLSSTRWGQQAIALDTAGILSKIGSIKQRAEFRVV